MGFLGIYGRVFRTLAPERRTVLVLSAANLVVAALAFVEPVLFGRLVDILSNAAVRGADATWRASLLTLAAWGGIGLVGILANVLVALYADRLAHRLRLAALGRFFAHVLDLPFAFHSSVHSNHLLKIMLQAVDHLFFIWLPFFQEHEATLATLIVLLPFSLILNWRLGLLLVALMLVFVCAAAVTIRHTEAAQRTVESVHTEMVTRAGDAFGNVLLIQSFVRLAAEKDALTGLMGRVLAAQYPVLTWWAVVKVLTRAASTITIMAIFALGTWLNLAGKASVGEIVSFMGFAMLLIGKLERAAGFISRLFYQLPGLADYFAVLDTTSSVRERPGAPALPRVRGEIDFDHVSISYDGARAAVSGLDFHIRPGTMTALVGPTGAGKTTAMALLMRLHDPQSGAIRIDGIDIRDVTLASLRANIGVVFQESMLFHRSIAENLRAGKPTASDAELASAARLAEAHEFIMAQKEGYQTLVGERGATLSGGERQRLAIARALLKDPPILILDEATSALDSRTEASVQRALGHLMAGRTTFVIAHRLASVRHADLILVLDHGRIVERGTHRELIARHGLYAELVKTQLDLEHAGGTAGRAETPPPAATGRPAPGS